MAKTGRVRPSDIAKDLGVSDRTLRRWADRGLVNCIRLPSGQRRYDVKELGRLMKMSNGEEEYMTHERIEEIFDEHCKDWCSTEGTKIKTGGFFDRIFNGRPIEIETHFSFSRSDMIDTTIRQQKALKKQNGSLVVEEKIVGEAKGFVSSRGIGELRACPSTVPFLKDTSLIALCYKKKAQ